MCAIAGWIRGIEGASPAWSNISRVHRCNRSSMYVGVVREKSCKIAGELCCVGRYGDHYCSRMCNDLTIPYHYKQHYCIFSHRTLFLGQDSLSSGLGLARKAGMHDRLAVGPGVSSTEASPECSICATSHADTAIERACQA
jgi:hypothetical protein